MGWVAEGQGCAAGVVWRDWGTGDGRYDAYLIYTYLCSVETGAW